MKREVLSALLALWPLCMLTAQERGFVVLGDLHIDRFEYHDMDYVRTRPQDFAQITREYPYYTVTYLPKLLSRVEQVSRGASPGICAVVQLGDLTQGVSGTDALARQMARGAVDMLYGSGVRAPWIVAKGNHDVSASPGQPEAWREVAEPFIERQIGRRTDEGMYEYRAGDFHFFVLDQFFSPDRMRPETDAIAFLERELPRSDTPYKFLVTHQPVIPVTERCWHLFAGIRRPMEDADRIRERFLELIASHRVVVLCAHLHKYSKIVRATSKGDVVQIMFNSVVSTDTPPREVKTSTTFPGQNSFDEKWQPSTNARRREILAREAPFIKSYTCDERAGYGVVSADKEGLTMRFYAGYGTQPCDSLVIAAAVSK